MKMIKKYGAEIFFVISSLIVFILIFSLPQHITQEEIPIPVPEPVLKFGLPVDSFSITEGVIQNNQNLSDILVRYGVDLATIDRLARSSHDTFDVRKIRVGQGYFIFRSPDSLKIPLYFVYESSKTEYVIFELGDNPKAYNGRKEVEIQRKTINGVIESSLWNSITAQDADPVLAIDMSKIFAWTIDFFGIQKGDHYRVIYDEQFVDGKSVGVGPIYAAQFNHAGKDIFAFRFYQENGFYYFNEKGVNLKGAFLKAPLSFSRISSRFSNSRMHPVLKIRRPHHGVDYAAPQGTPVLSIGDGTIIEKAFQKGGGGNYLKIKHNSVYTTVYMHLSKYANGITRGVRVSQGQVIGYVGSTGLASGPHLDFRVYQNGQPIDPLKMKSEPGKPVSEENMAAFKVLKDSLMNELILIQGK